jgi:hypothetical protein
VSERACEACGADNRATARFCRRCGEAIDDAAPLPAAALAPTASVAAAFDNPTSTDPLAPLYPVAGFFGTALGAHAIAAFAVRAAGVTHADAQVGLSFLVAFLAVVFAATEPGTFSTLVARPRPSPSLVTVVGPAIAGLAVAAAYLAVLFVVARVPRLGLLEGFGAESWPRWLGIALICVVAPASEELAFRGYVLGRLGRVLRQRDALVLQAALFSALHLAPLSLPSHFMLGLVFGHVRARTGSLIPGMLLHAGWNAAVVALGHA